MSFLQKIQHRIWSNAQYKFSIVFCSIYVVLFNGKIIPSNILWLIFISILLSIGVAGIGYVWNDIYDYKDDVKNNKRNLFINFSKLNSTLLVVLLLCLSILPWFILPFDFNSLLLISLEFFLFMVYALPPFRLKERGVLGLLTDAMYAQVIPCLLASYTYAKISGGVTISLTFVLVYISWLLLMGVRNIINHQIEDYENDINTNTQTFVTKVGFQKSYQLVLRYLVPIELLIFFIVLYSLPSTQHIFIFAYIMYIIAYYIKEKIAQKDILSNVNFRYDFFNKQLLNEFYEIHLPLLLLLYFSYFEHFFIWILIVNLILFLPIYYRYTIGFFKKYF